MIRCNELEKENFDIYAKELYKILYDNMSVITSTDLQYERWYSNVKTGLRKDPRKILLLQCDEELIGFFQYYVNAGTFMVEEIQIAPGYQVTHGVFRVLSGFLLSKIPEDTRYIAAYADERNLGSRRIIEKLGLASEKVEENGLIYYRGLYEIARAHFLGKRIQ